jgi:hypothetical protein
MNATGIIGVMTLPSVPRLGLSLIGLRLRMCSAWPRQPRRQLDARLQVHLVERLLKALLRSLGQGPDQKISWEGLETRRLDHLHACGACRFVELCDDPPDELHLAGNIGVVRTRVHARRDYLPPPWGIRTDEVEHDPGALGQRLDRLWAGDIDGHDFGLVHALVSEHSAHLIRVAPRGHPPRIRLVRARRQICNHAAPGHPGRTQHRHIDVSFHAEKLMHG